MCTELWIDIFEIIDLAKREAFHKAFFIGVKWGRLLLLFGIVGSK